MKSSKFENYGCFPEDLLAPVIKRQEDPERADKLREKARKLEETLKSFGFDAHVVNMVQGPAFSRFDLTFDGSAKVSRIKALEDDSDFCNALGVYSIRVEAPTPGKSFVGIEIPNEKLEEVTVRELIETEDFKGSSPLTVPIGKDVEGNLIYCDLAKTGHLLIAGTTGSGKSICIRSFLTGILLHSSPEDVKMILVDTKIIELSVYNKLPHLLLPVINEPKKALSALAWAISEKERRLKLFEEERVENIDEYNAKHKDGPEGEHLPFILFMIDEFEPLMSVAKEETETLISRLVPYTADAGINLLIATQIPSLNVISSVIYNNIGSKIAFAVCSADGSKVILHERGAEKLRGMGDMLYVPVSAMNPLRVQGVFISDEEVETVCGYFRNRYGAMYDEAVSESIDKGSFSFESTIAKALEPDELYEKAVRLVILKQRASISEIQRALDIGYPRAARLIDRLEKEGVIGPFDSGNQRKVLITDEEWRKRRN